MASASHQDWGRWLRGSRREVSRKLWGSMSLERNCRQPVRQSGARVATLRVRAPPPAGRFRAERLRVEAGRRVATGPRPAKPPLTSGVGLPPNACVVLDPQLVDRGGELLGRNPSALPLFT